MDTNAPKPVESSYASQSQTSHFSETRPSNSEQEFIKSRLVVEGDSIKTQDPSQKNSTQKPEQPTTESATPKSEEASTIAPENSKKVKWPIQFKMMAVLTILLSFTMAVIITLATYFFKKDSDVRIRENALSLTKVVGLKVKSDLLALVDKGKAIGLIVGQNISETEKNFLLKLLLQNDPEILYLGVYKLVDGKLENPREVFNEESVSNMGMTTLDLQTTVKSKLEEIAKADGSDGILLSNSVGLPNPNFLLAFSGGNEKAPVFIVMSVKSEKIMPAFAKEGIITTFMVNGKGEVIAHSDANMVKESKVLTNSPIVKKMITSTQPTLQSEFSEKEEPFLGTFQKIGFSNTGIIATVPLNLAFQVVYRIQNQNYLIMGIGLILALMVVFFFAKTISNPVLKLLDATVEIARGNFRFPIRASSKDEVGLLTTYFQSMSVGLEEREKVKSILGSMIDPTVVQEAMKDMAALKRGSETEITAFFSDVAGFSSISEKLKSFELAALLNEYLSAMTIILKQYDGVLDKYIGDAIVGIFNAPVPLPDYNFKAAKASVEMIKKLRELRDYWKKNRLYIPEAQEMDVRIGLNSGLAKVGLMGTDALASYTMMGDTVNLAARLEAAGKDYGVNILISELTKERIEDRMFTRLLDQVRVKGKNEPVRIYELIDEKTLVPQNIFESAKLYEEAFSFYLKGNFDAAIQKLKESERAKGLKDKGMKVLLERCEEYKSNPPPRDWDGVFTRTHK